MVMNVLPGAGDSFGLKLWAIQDGEVHGGHVVGKDRYQLVLLELVVMVGVIGGMAVGEKREHSGWVRVGGRCPMVTGLMGLCQLVWRGQGGRGWGVRRF